MKVYVLNLPEATQRLANITSCYPSDMPPFEVWVGKTGDEIEIPDWWKGSPRMASNRQNFIDLFDACASGTENFLILEDDCVFAENFKTKLDAFLEEVPDDWEYLNLGACHLQHNLLPPKQISENVLRPKFPVCTHAILVKPTGATKARDIIIQEGWGGRHVTDQRIALLFYADLINGYSPLRNFAGQAGGQSTLCQIVRNGDDYFNDFRYIDLEGKTCQSVSDTQPKTDSEPTEV
ncbi:MAG: hypothetical protein Q4C70_01465 [Planctomycetia bacterium]|nr:hypothetical protein [Planctomycetia bacterium]